MKRTCGQVYANKACNWTKETKKAKEWNCSCEAVDDNTPCNSGFQTTISTVLVLFAVANTLQKVASQYIFRIWVFRSVDFKMFHFFTLLLCIVLYKGLIVTAQMNFGCLCLFCSIRTHIWLYCQSCIAFLGVNLRIHVPGIDIIVIWTICINLTISCSTLEPLWMLCKTRQSVTSAKTEYQTNTP